MKLSSRYLSKILLLGISVFMTLPAYSSGGDTVVGDYTLSNVTSGTFGDLKYEVDVALEQFEIAFCSLLSEIAIFLTDALRHTPTFFKTAVIWLLCAYLVRTHILSQLRVIKEIRGFASHLLNSIKSYQPGKDEVGEKAAED